MGLFKCGSFNTLVEVTMYTTPVLCRVCVRSPSLSADLQFCHRKSLLKGVQQAGTIVEDVRDESTGPAPGRIRTWMHGIELEEHLVDQVQDLEGDLESVFYVLFFFLRLLLQP